MKQKFKLVRICEGKYLSANASDTVPRPPFCLEYKVGEVTEVDSLGIACYKTLEQASRSNHISETMDAFNGGKAIAVIALEPIGKSVYKDIRYEKGRCYEGGINYRAVKVVGIVRVIEGGVDANSERGSYKVESP